MDFDPSKADEIVNLPSLVSKINLPGVSNDETSLTCFTDDDDTNKCFTAKNNKEISCKGDKCFVNYKTMSQKLLGNGKRITKLNLDVLINPSGLSTTIQLIGSIPRKKISMLKKIIGDVKIIEVNELPALTTGMPRPPAKCHLNPLGRGCSQYLSSDDYAFIPLIGFKKTTDIIKNPGTILKSEVFPRIKKIAGTIANAIHSRGKKNEKNEVTR